MKTSVLNRNKVPAQVVALISRLVELIPWPLRRQAMGDVALSLLDGKHRVAEEVFGWNRATVELGVHESRTGISCINDLSNRQKPKTEEKDPKLLDDIREIIDPLSHAEARLRTTLLYTHITARAIYDALVQKG